MKQLQKPPDKTLQKKRNLQCSNVQYPVLKWSYNLFHFLPKMKIFYLKNDLQNLEIMI